MILVPEANRISQDQKKVRGEANEIFKTYLITH